MTSKTLEAIRYARGSLELLDQLALPLQTTFIPVATCDDGFRAIKDMNVRGTQTRHRPRSEREQWHRRKMQREALPSRASSGVS